MDQQREQHDITVFGPTAWKGSALANRSGQVLALLTLHRDRTVSSEEIADVLWVDRPASWRKAVQNTIVALRRTMGVEAIATTPSGYRLAVGSELIDVADFEAASRSHGFDAAQITAALTSWRGEPYHGIARDPDVTIERSRLQRLRQRYLELLANHSLDSGDVGLARELAEDMVADDPYAEEGWRVLAVALYRAGRRAESLDVLHRARRILASEVGLELGPKLQRTEQFILDDDPALYLDRAQTEPPQPSPAARPFRGREPELDLLHAGVKEASKRIAVVRGPAGIGKTSLLRQLTTELRDRGVTVLNTSADQNITSAYEPLVVALTQVAGAVAGDELIDVVGPNGHPAGWLSPELGFALDRVDPDRRRGSVSDLSRERLDRAIVEVLGSLAMRGPTVFIIDDSQWMTPVVADLVMQLARGESDLNVVLAIRTGEQLDPSVAGIVAAASTMVELDGLDVESVRLVVRDLVQAADDDVGNDVAAQVRAATGGHPLFVSTLVGHLLRTGMLAERSGSWAIESMDKLPPDVKELITERLGLLDVESRRLLNVIALAAGDLRLDAAVDVAAVGTGAATRLTRAGLIDPGEHPTAHHDLIARAVEDQLSGGARTEINQKIGRSLEATGTREATVAAARHLLASATIDPARSIRAAIAAGDVLNDAFDFAQAAAVYRLGLDALDAFDPSASPWRCDLHARWGRALRRAGLPGHREALMVAARVADELDDSIRFVDAVTELCFLQPSRATDLSAEEPEALAFVEHALTLDVSTEQAIALWTAASFYFSLSVGWRRSQELFSRAEEASRQLDDDRLRINTLPLAYLGLGHPDQLERRAAVAAELVELGIAHDDRTSVFEGRKIQFSAAIQRADDALMGECIAEMEAVSGELHEAIHEWELTYNQSVLHHVSGDLVRAEDYLNASLAFGGGAESRNMTVFTVGIVTIRDHQGRLPELAPLIGEHLDAMPDVNWRPGAVAIELASGNIGAATELFDVVTANDFARLSEDVSWTACMCLLARMPVVGGDRPRAQLLYDRLVGYAGRWAWCGAHGYGPIDLALGELTMTLGDRAAAAAHLETACTMASVWPEGCDYARARWSALRAARAGLHIPHLGGIDLDAEAQTLRDAAEAKGFHLDVFARLEA